MLIFIGPLEQLFDQLSAFFPKFIGALSILFFGWLISRTVGKILSKVLATIGVDRLAAMFEDIEFVQRAGGMKAQVSEVLAKGVYYMLMLIFIIAATEILGVAAITQLFTDLMNYLPSLLTASVILLVGIFFANVVQGLVQTLCVSLGIASAKMIGAIVFYFIFVTIAVSALAQAKINTDFISSNLTAIVGAVALAFAFGYGIASKDMISNYLAGYYNRNKIRIGDDVRIIGVRGKVVMMDATSLILQTPERAIIIPLNKLTTEKVEVFYPDGQEDHLLEPGADS
ncbi:MAG: mechanosensitive ion channel [Lewinellaceae bacterium]|nr:mechanosensitive ion channel [Saprospiraceae bacterium]MCB9344458.1 mechanosensitive ion channel [Lewinellaceae bacterium]